jgi:peroxiredoxin
LRDREADFDHLGVKIVVVTFANNFMARSYVDDTRLAWPLLVDENRSVYQNYSMLSASFWDIWGPKTWLAYARELLKGKHLVKSEDDIYQRGGDVLIDPQGIVRLHHVGTGPADRPGVGLILRMIRMQRSTERQD